MKKERFEFAIFRGRFDWKSLLTAYTDTFKELQLVCTESVGERTQLVFVDLDWISANPVKFDELVSMENRPYMVAVDHEEGNIRAISRYIKMGAFDDILLFPFREYEVWSKFQRVVERDAWNEMILANEQLSGLVENFRADLEFVRELHQKRVTGVDTGVQGIKIDNRYLAGLKSGGDFFDVAESTGGSTVALMLTHASTYGLSSAIMAAMMKVATQVSTLAAHSSHEVVRCLVGEIKSILGKSGRLDLFFGFVSRKNLKLNYVHLGSHRIYHYSDGKLRALQRMDSAIHRRTPYSVKDSKVVQLRPRDRLFLLSEGVSESLSAKELKRLVEDYGVGKTANRFLNELTNRLKNSGRAEEELLDQDCTGVVLEIQAGFLRAV